MTPADPRPATAPRAGVADAHQSTVDAVLAAAEQGMVSAADAELMIDRVRTHAAAHPVAHREDTS